jgi:serine/threonine protein kinase
MGELERSSQTGTWTDRFEVRHKIAAGSYGVVYLAHDRQRGLEVALKVLRG